MSPACAVKPPVTVPSFSNTESTVTPAAELSSLIVSTPIVVSNVAAASKLIASVTVIPPDDKSPIVSA